MINWRLEIRAINAIKAQEAFEVIEPIAKNVLYSVDDMNRHYSVCVSQGDSYDIKLEFTPTPDDEERQDYHLEDDNDMFS